jgi:hypothetical protein
MRRHLLLLLLIITIVSTLGAVGCGDSDSASRLSPLGQAAASQSDEPGQSSDVPVPTPTEILAAVATNTAPATTQVGTFDLTIDLDIDEAVMGEEGAQFFKDPIKLAGSMAMDMATEAADVTLDLTLMGEAMNVGIKALDGQAWISLGNKWYEAPPDMMGATDTTSDGGLDATMAQIQGLVTKISLDPIAWFKNQAPVKVEKIDGATVYHLSGSDPDWAKVVADIVKMSQDPAFTQLMGEAQALGEELPVDAEMPTAEELQQVQSLLEALIDELQIDLWVQQDNSRLRKATFSARMTAPSEEDLAALEGMDVSASDFEGLNSVTMSGTINLNPDEAVKVSAPDSPLPYADLETDIMEDPSMLGPLGTMLMGAMGGTDSF